MQVNNPTRFVLLLPMVVAALIAAWTFWGFQHTGWFSDSLDYLWFADFYLQSFNGEPSAQAAATFRTTRFPPLLPLLLAAVGAGSENPAPAAALMFVLFTACAGLATWWAFRATRDIPAAVLCGLSLALSPGWFLLQQFSPVSEPLMLALVLAALLLAGDGPLTRGRALALALVAGAVPLARTIGIAMAIPVAVRLLGDRELGRLRFGLAGMALLPFVAWSLLRASLPESDSYTDSLTLESIRSVYGGVMPWLAGQPQRMVEGAAAMLANVPGVVAIAISAMLAVLAVLGAVVGWRRLDAQFLLLYCGIIFIWPYPAEMPRFMGLLLPIALVLATRASAGLFSLWKSGAPASRGRLLAGLSAAMIAVAMPAVIHNAHLAVRHVDPELEPFKHYVDYYMAQDDESADQRLEFAARLATALQELPDLVHAGECVYAQLPQMVSYIAKVRAVATPRGLVDSAQARERLVACRYLLASAVQTRQYNEPHLYPVGLVVDDLRPLLISYMDVDGTQVPVVGLFEIKPPLGAVVAPETP